jgi:mannan endo-1,4-beta-mannosidase
MYRRYFALFTLSAIFLTGILSGKASAQTSPPDLVDAHGHHFVRHSGRFFFHRGLVFRIAGSNNYYPMYVSQTMVDDLLTTAAASSFNVFRFWGFLDIGNQDGSNSVDGIHNGVYFQYWDGVEPAYNDGPTGLQHLDYVIYKAGQLNLKVIIPFVNNWKDFGGMDQYVRWKGGQYHDDFYTDPTIRTWYHAWISHMLNHTNIYTGIKYKDDATIMEWELANEPRCGGSGVYPQSSTCNTLTLTTWADEVSTFIKTIDKKHLVSTGDEGFYCTDPTSSDFTINCSQGVDTIALASLPNMDTMSYHLYPDSWGKDATWGTQWIAQHIQDSHRLRERGIMGEFGYLDKATRNPVYKQWEDTVLKDDGAGALYWILSDKQDNGTYYPDFDGFTVYCPSPVCTTFTNFARLMELRPPFDFSPVADDDNATTQHDTSVTLTPLTNDITYMNAKLLPNSIDLDPSTPGQQKQFTMPFGTYTLQSGGTVLYTPAPGFSGTSSTPYTVKDSFGRTSHPANLIITVKGNPNTLYTFEDGTDTWMAASFNATAGTTAQSTSFATDGTHSLQINATADGGWFGPALAPPLPLPLTNVHQILMDITTTTAGTSQSVALQVGNDFHWCQTDFGFINAGTSTTITVDLPTLLSSTTDCLGSLPADTSVLQAIWVYFNGGGTSYLDNVRYQ